MLYLLWQREIEITILTSKNLWIINIEDWLYMMQRT